MFTHSLLAALALAPPTLAQVSNDFESGWDQTAWPQYAPDCAQGGTVTLDSTIAHSGKNSIKVVGGSGGYCGHAFFGTTAVPTGDIYVRSWIRASTALTANHVTLTSMTDASQSGKHLRFGGQSNILDYNRESDDATLPDLSPQGIASSVGLTPNTWTCLEQHIGADGTIETWIDDAAVAGLTVGPGKTNANANGWTRAAYTPKITGVYFGWEAYGGDINTIWYDDVAVASKKIGCGAATGGSGGGAGTSPKPTTLTTSRTAVPVTTTVKAPSPTPTGCTSQKYGQCGGIGWAGCTVCAAGSTCQANGPYYSQCL